MQNQLYEILIWQLKWVTLRKIRSWSLQVPRWRLKPTRYQNQYCSWSVKLLKKSFRFKVQDSRFKVKGPEPSPYLVSWTLPIVKINKIIFKSAVSITAILWIIFKLSIYLTICFVLGHRNDVFYTRRFYQIGMFN